MLLLVAVLAGCKGSENVVYEIHDTIIQTRYDSVFQIAQEKSVFNMRDSVSHVEFMRGDTMFVKDFSYLFRERIEHLKDSTSTSKADTVRESIVKTEPVYIEKPLSPKERLLQKLGVVFLAFLTLMVSYVIIRIAVKRNVFSSLWKLL